MGQSGSSESTAKPRPKPEEKSLREIYAAQLDGCAEARGTRTGDGRYEARARRALRRPRDALERLA